MLAQPFPFRKFNASVLCALFWTALATQAHAADARALKTVETDLAGNQLTALETEHPAPPNNEDKGCTADGSLCIALVNDGHNAPPSLHVTRLDANPVELRLALQDAKGHPDLDDMNFALWPHVLRLADRSAGVLVGITQHFFTGYAGGGGSSSELRLFRIVPTAAQPHGQEVLSVPVAGSLLIRACFSERDQRHRRGACHDEYTFAATLHLDRSVKSGFPRLLYTTLATSFPGHVSRDADSLAAPPLRKRDLVTAVDPKCTYQRTFQFTPATGGYEPNRPLPECDDYTTP